MACSADVDLLLYMVCHDSASFERASKYSMYSWIIPIQIPSTVYMESIVFTLLPQRIHEWKDKTHVGIIKYSFEEKTPFYDFPLLCSSHPLVDVFTFVNGHEDDFNLPNPSMIAYAGICHTLFPVVWYNLLREFDVAPEQMFNVDIPAFYSNFWIAKKEYFQDYLDFINESIKVMGSNKELARLLSYNANYLERLDPMRLKEIMNAPYYTYHCFVAERLPCFYFWNAKCSILPVGGKQRMGCKK